MRDIKNVRPLNISLKRNILMFVTPLLVMLLAYIFFMTPAAHAAPTADITWKENSIIYADKTYTGPTTARADDGHDLPQGTVLYTYLEPRAPFSSQKSHVIYFDADVDPSKAATAQYVTYDRNATNGLSGKSPPTELSIDTTTSPSASTSTNDSPSTCKIDGVGWIVCSVSNFLAIGMDWVFGVLSGFVEVQPLATNSNSVMYRIWDMMRSIANIAFVIAFLVIIYAQLTSSGISNYGIKKILPRVIVAAILVNVSYWICVVAIDVSNILGHSLQGIFLSLRDSILEDGSGNNWNLVSWESVTSFILAGGAAGGAAIAGLVGLSATMGAFSVAGVALLLAPILVGAFLTILVVLFILAARQAIITLLVIISPLALVAYLLPNTEKWFEKWRGLFMTMLIFFPAFSLVFGGAQFAGLVIIQTADNINMLLLGMAVQVAPLAITPLLLKLSGSLLSKVAGIINDPSKGLKDRTKNWSKDRLAARKAGEDRKTREMAQNGTLRRRHIVRRTALSADNRRRLREGQKTDDEKRSDALFDRSQSGHALHEAQHAANTLKETVEAELSVALKTGINLEGSQLHLDNLTLEATKAEVKNQEAVNATQMANYRAGDHANPRLGIQAQMHIGNLSKIEDQISIQGLAAQGAKRVKDSEFAEFMEHNVVAQGVAGGIEGSKGAQRAIATALKTTSSAHGEAVSNAGVIIDHGNYEDAQITELALGNAGTTGIQITDDIREAAIKRTAGGKNSDEIVKLMREIDIPNLSQDLRQELGNSLLTNGDKPKWIGAGTAGAIKQGVVNPNGNERIRDWIVSAVNDNKLGSAETLVSQDKTYLKEVYEAMSDPATLSRMNTTQKVEIKQQIHMMLHDNRFKGRIAERDENIGKIYDKLGSVSGSPDTYLQAKVIRP